MNFKRPLARRIVIAFVAMNLVVSGAFALGIVAVVHAVEEHLVSQSLDGELDRAMVEDFAHSRPLELDLGTRFYTSHPRGPRIPPAFIRLGDGFSEVIDGNQASYAYQKRLNGERYLLVREQHDFEKREQALFDVVLAGFLLSVLGAWGLGSLLARRIMAPVTRLAHQVRQRDQLLPVAPPLKADYAADEVGQLASAFDSTLDHLRQALEREKLFTGDVSHEFRTPLMVIASSCELLLEFEGPTENQRQQLLRIQRAGSEMRDLVQTFLLLARDRPEKADMAVRKPLSTIADTALQRFCESAEAKGLRLSLTIEDPDERLYNASFLGFVMANLLRNALHYTDSGEIRLILRRGGFRVEDCGIGIPPTQREQIFDPFFRGDRSRGEGLGLGLSIVRRICRHQGWQVVVRPVSPRGSCFEVTLDSA